MKQLAHRVGSGRLTVEEVPLPLCGPGMVAIRNHYSLISPGTEAGTVRTARAGLLSKARKKPEEVRRVVELCRRQGPVQAYRAVMKKLDAYSPLGYSSAGEVIAVGTGVSEFTGGDLAAAAGAGYASHAEVISVPVNLCVKLPVAARLDFAAYNTLGAIALQGIRQADLKLGETCVVIGLGLIGQLTCLMLRASGVRTLGVDVNSFAVQIAREHACDAAFQRSDSCLIERIDAFTDGRGADSVIITAATASLDPINFAGRVSRKRGRIIVVGAVPTGFDREPFWYRNELELRMSCSYGPGRYDPNYEERGEDYPAAYVRWTEKRNMEAFQRLVHDGRIDLAYLSTHEFDISEVSRAYELILERKEPFLGVLVRYQIDKPVQRQPILLSAPAWRPGAVRLAFVGAGSYAQSHLLPNLPSGDRDISRTAVMSQSGLTSKRVAEKFGFQRCVSEPADIFENPEVNTIFIATRHDSHARYTSHGLLAGKHVFVEKPLALSEDQLNQVTETFNRRHHAPLLMVGYNRRFSSLAIDLKQELSGAPASMLYRINAGRIPRNSWIQDEHSGGGRIIGEVCHFIDFMSFICESLPSSVFATELADTGDCHDTVNIQIAYENGSIGTIAYYANGSSDVEKEYFEVYSSGLIGIIRDFRKLDIHRPGAHMKRRLWSQDKGQKRMLYSFLNAVKQGQPSPIPFEHLRKTSMSTFCIRQSLVSGQPVRVS